MITYENNLVISAVGRPIEVHLDPMYFTLLPDLAKIYAELQLMTKRYAPYNLPAGYSYYGFTLPAKFEGSRQELYAKYQLYDQRNTVSAGEFRQVKVITDVTRSLEQSGSSPLAGKFLLMCKEPAIVGDTLLINKVLRTVKYAESVYFDMTKMWLVKVSTVMSPSQLLPKLDYEPSSYDLQDIATLQREVNALKNITTELVVQINTLMTTGANGAGPVAFAGLAGFGTAVNSKITSETNAVNAELNKLRKEAR